MFIYLFKCACMGACVCVQAMKQCVLFDWLFSGCGLRLYLAYLA